MERFPQELIDKIIDNVSYLDLEACSLVGSRWVERSQCRMRASGYCWFIDRQHLYLWRSRLLAEGSIFVTRTHSLTLCSTAVLGWALYFRHVDVVLPHLESLTITNTLLRFDPDVIVMKRHFGNTISSLSLNRILIEPRDFYTTLSSFPKLDDLSIIGLDLQQLPAPSDIDMLSGCPRTRGKLTLVGVEAHDVCLPPSETADPISHTLLLRHCGCS